MKQPDNRVRVAHILDAVDAALRWTAGCEWADFANDDQLQSAVIYQIQIIGEAAARLTPEFRAAHTGIPWDAVIKMRHILVHDYMRVDAAVVWQVVSSDLPPLSTLLRRLLVAEW
jgi:uncharacterized protein with HEPN domain